MKNGEILHITKDEKFINGAYYLFEKAFPGLNRFVVLKPPADPPLRYLNNELVANAQFKIISKATIQDIANLSTEFSATVLHGIHNHHASIFSSAIDKDRFMGIVHGAEVYNNDFMNMALMGEKTRHLYKHTSRITFVERVKNVLRKIKYYNHEYPDEVALTDIMYQIQVFGSLPGRSNANYIDENLYNPFVKQVPFSYYPIDFIINDKTLKVQGNNILFGNSAFATNNHLEGLDILKSLDIGDRRIIAPLSYGSEKYAKAIIKEGKKQFADQFVSLERFLPIDVYNRVISSCGIVIMNHYRPQAVGNIIAALYLGAKVFLNDTDTYRYFKGLGCHIFLIEKDLTSQREPFKLLEEEQITHNRAVLEDYLSTESLVQGMRKAFDENFDFKRTLQKRETVL